MLPDGRRIGAHLPLGGGMVAAVERAHALGLDTLQVFADNPTAWKRRTEPPRELPPFRARFAELGMGPLAIHAAYLVNLAGPDDDFHARSVEVLRSELEAAVSFGARFVNLHVGSHKGTGAEGGVVRLADGLARVLGEVDNGPDAAIVVLENSAGAGGGLGVDLAELSGILEAIADRGVDDGRVAICLDTAHLWGAGHPISEPDAVDELVDDFDRRIGLGRLAMVHLNDSKAALGSRADRHEHLGAGSIGAAGLGRFLRHPDLARAAFYLETPGMDEGYDALNAARAFDLAAGRDLEPLPPEALTVRGSRARTGP